MCSEEAVACGGTHDRLVERGRIALELRAPVRRRRPRLSGPPVCLSGPEGLSGPECAHVFLRRGALGVEFCVVPVKRIGLAAHDHARHVVEHAAALHPERCRAPLNGRFGDRSPFRSLTTQEMTTPLGGALSTLITATTNHRNMCYGASWPTETTRNCVIHQRRHT